MNSSFLAIVQCISVCMALVGVSCLDPIACAQEQASYRLPVVAPVELGFDENPLKQIEAIVSQGIGEGKMPGCVVCFGRQGKIAWLKAYGNKRLEPEIEPMTTDTLFDMASITKPMATATSVMKLLEMGSLRLSQKVVDFFPEFSPNGKDEITVRDLLIHQSGLIPDNSIADYELGPDVAWQKICDLKLVAPVGKEFKYSDVNFIVLAKIVERLSGLNVNDFSQQHIFKPLRMSETGYIPKESLRARAAPTETRNGSWMQGEVHDPRAHLLQGIAGHAGLFSSAEDIAVYASMMLNHGQLQIGEQTVKILAPATVQLMTAPNRVSSGIRGLGWDKQTGYSSNKGDFLSSYAFGHGGFTGTVLWMDPELDLFYIFLSNRVHPNGKGYVNPLAGQILNVVATSLREPSKLQTGAHTSPQPTAQTGIDVLVRDNFRQLAGARIGLITNHTGRSADGRSTAELLQSAEQVDLTALFSPEHGFSGNLDVSKIGDTQDQKTGLKVYSLYGETRRPTAEMLADVDTLVFDIQDIGARFYTYVSTMGEAMRAAAEHKKKFVVLDRPNPINGIDVAGPMLDAGLESFVGFHHLPVRHGMTIGELALMFNAELKLELNLEIIRCENWTRDQYWESTGLAWINPSPNMRCLTQATLYPGVGLLETTNVSVGRGTDTPFEVIGAPWINHLTLARDLQSLSLPGVVFIPIEFTPTSSKFEGELCYGINIAITDRSKMNPLQVGFALATALRKLHPAQWETKSLNRLLGNQEVAQAILDGKTTAEILQLARSDIADFTKRRAEFLIY